MLLDEEELTYAYVGCCMVEYPLWFSLVLRAVGLMGDGDTGDRRGSKGDLRDSDGRPAVCTVEVEMLKDNFGFATLEESMVDGLIWYDKVTNDSNP